MEADILPHLSLFPRKAFTAHVSEERGKNVMVLFIATVAILKKREREKKIYLLALYPLTLLLQKQ